jgi:hypothetical protein
MYRLPLTSTSISLSLFTARNSYVFFSDSEHTAGLVKILGTLKDEKKEEEAEEKKENEIENEGRERVHKKKGKVTKKTNWKESQEGRGEYEMGKAKYKGQK